MASIIMCRKAIIMVYNNNNNENNNVAVAIMAIAWQ
jgi:hypothetical protein